MPVRRDILAAGPVPASIVAAAGGGELRFARRGIAHG